jgi:SSS family solute:Na+ symporter
MAHLSPVWERGRAPFWGSLSGDGVYSPRMKTGFFLAVAAYTVVLLAAGLGYRRRGASLDSFFLASRRLGAGRVAFSLCASWIGAASLLVSTDEARLEGAGAFWLIGLPAVVTLILLTALARPIRAVSGLTPSEIVRDRYGRTAGALTTVLVVWYMTVLAASQMVAAGPFLGTFLGISPGLGMILAAGLVMLYSAAGGLQAVARAHVLQFVLLVGGLAGMTMTLASRTTWRAVRAAAAAAGKTSYFDPAAGAAPNALIALSFVLAWTISPIAWQRMQAARSARSASGGTAAAAVLLGGFYAAIVAAGMLGLPLYAGGGPPLITRFALDEGGSFLGGLVFITVLAAIFSTMDAALNAGAFTLTKDLLGRPGSQAQEGRPLTLGRITTSALALVALVIAVRLGDILKTLGLASAVMAEGLLVPGLAALFLKRRAPLAGLLGLTIGGGYAVASFLADSGLSFIPLPPWPRSLPLGVALGAAAFLAGLALEKRRAGRGDGAGRHGAGEPAA